MSQGPTARPAESVTAVRRHGEGSQRRSSRGGRLDKRSAKSETAMHMAIEMEKPRRRQTSRLTGSTVGVWVCGPAGFDRRVRHVSPDRQKARKPESQQNAKMPKGAGGLDSRGDYAELSVIVPGLGLDLAPPDPLLIPSYS